MKKPLLMLAAAALLALPACSKKPETQAQAGGEILEGSISDAMLPLDTATSQPPLAPKTAPNTGGSDDGSDAADEGANEKDKAAPAKADDPAPRVPAAEPE